ncbi:MAG: Glutamate synthase [NADPH] large chain precursor [Candidatus Heimdallarchaeota archaeon LC_3]|nr:MAG: Glutamate synthase [NADPH] large chain precursor [Candidatus Heimdallarchaeota archaeon LC_3]
MIVEELILTQEKQVSNIHKGLELLPSKIHKSGALGNKRWTDELILSTWQQASSGKPPTSGLEYKIGKSNGGFDRLHFKSNSVSQLKPDEDIDLVLPLNGRSEGPKINISLPIYGGGMSYGSISLNFMLARAIAFQKINSFFSTGEGGYPPALFPYKENIITQIATGLFGVNEETIKMSRILEFKYAQGAKPGLGGHLLADKVTTEVAKMRESVDFSSLYSPFPFHSVYSVEDHKKHVDWVKSINPDALISVKVSTPRDVDMVAIGSYYAGANIINLDGGFGGTGAAPEIAKKNIAMPIEYAIPKVHKFLESEGVRDEIVLIASGGIRTAYDVTKAIALGADGCVTGTSETIAVGCTHCGNCEKGRGCQVGITTTDPYLSTFIDPEWGAQRIINLFSSWKMQWEDLLRNLGLKSIRDLRGRTDLLLYK